MREIEIIKIASILDIKSWSIHKCEGPLPVMMIGVVRDWTSFNRGDVIEHYSNIIRDVCKDEYIFQKTSMDIINPIGYPFNTTTILDTEPEVGKSFTINAWRTSVITRIIDNNIIITNNSVYVLHSVSELRNKRLNDLGI